jgi:hypothetical protein
MKGILIKFRWSICVMLVKQFCEGLVSYVTSYTTEDLLVQLNFDQMEMFTSERTFMLIRILSENWWKIK